MTIPETNTACSLRHIGVLATHGAEVQGPNGRQKLDADFFLYVMNECREKGFNAVCYELFLPEISDGTVLPYVATAANGWHAVIVGDRVGWVSGKYSKIE